MTQFGRLLAGGVVAAFALGWVAWAQTRPAAPKLSPLLQRVSQIMTQEKMNPSSASDARLGPVVRAPVTVEGQPLELRISATKDDRVAIFSLQLKALRAPERIDKNTLLRMFIETREYGAASFAYNLEAKRFELRQPVFGADLSATTVRDAVKRLSNFAQVTRNLWDDSRWK